MKNWSFEEDYILCQACDKWGYMFDGDESFDALMKKFEEAGFGTRSRTAVQKRAYDCMKLFMGQELAHVSDIQKERCECFAKRKQMRAYSEELQAFLNRNHVYADTMVLDAITNVAPNTIALLPIGEVGPTFTELLCTYIKRSNMTEPQVYKRAQIGRDTFSNIYSGKKGASKEVVMRLCFGLKLTYDEAVGFMASANHGFNKSKILDLVVMYFLKNQIYDTYEVNAELYERHEAVLFDGRYGYYQ